MKLTPLIPLAAALFVSAQALALTEDEFKNIKCTVPEFELDPYNLKQRDSASQNVTIAIDPLGNIIRTPEGFGHFDENDKLIVKVVGKHSELESLSVINTSVKSGTSGPTFIGVPNTGPAPAVAGTQNNSGDKYCIRTFNFDSFSPGIGKLTLSQVDTSDYSKKSVGDTTFKVNPLHSGMFSLGIVQTDLLDYNYTLVTTDDGEIISRDTQGDSDHFYTLMYTHFIWGKRSENKPLAFNNIWERINPTFGIPQKDISDNFFLGLSIDLPGNFVVTWGKHFGKVTRINSDSGIELGDVYTGTVADIPTAKEWESDHFISLTFDLRAIGKLTGLRTTD